MNILIVDDSYSKIDIISRYISSNLEIYLPKIYNACTLRAARSMLKKNDIDVLLLDIVFPRMENGENITSAGIELVAEILDRGRYLDPASILILSAFSDILSEHGSFLQQSDIKTSYFDSKDERWKNSVDNILEEQTNMVKQGRIRKKVDICIQCALPDPEAKWAAKLLDNTSQLQLSPSGLQYFEGQITSNEQQLSVIIVQQNQPGPIESSIVGTKITYDFKPKLVFMTGICAGVGSDIGLGDILVSSHVWDWQRGKFSEENGSSKFLVEPIQEQCSTMLLQKMQIFSKTYDFNTLYSSWDFTKPERYIKLKIGPTATSSSVIASGAKIDEIKDSQNRKMIGLEMEGFGFYSSIKSSHEYDTHCMLIKSVSDKADVSKGDDFQPYCAHISAKFALDFARYVFDNTNL